MNLTFVTPLGAVFALTALVLLGVYAARLRRLSRMRRALGLSEPALRSHFSLAVSLALVPALLGIAAAQPVIETERSVRERTDAQVFVVVDVSRSMLAAADAGAPTRFERARRIAIALRDELPEVPFGVATLTDRVLPHLFPTTDERVFAATLRRAIGIEQPPPGAFYLTFATNLNALRLLPQKNYFLPSATKRVLVALTDGESQPPGDELTRAFDTRLRVETVFVHLWGAAERIYEAGVAEGGYRPEAESAATVARAASLVGGRLVDERDVDALAAEVRASVGEGPTVQQTRDARRLALMPWATVAVLLPLGLLLVRRNAWLRGPLRPALSPRLRRAREPAARHPAPESVLARR